MLSVSSRIWTRVAVSIDDNHYITGTSPTKSEYLSCDWFELVYYDVTVQHVSHYTLEMSAFKQLNTSTKKFEIVLEF